MSANPENSPIEENAPVPTRDARTSQQIRATNPADVVDQMDDDGKALLPSPVDWSCLDAKDGEAVLGMLADFLEWAVPRWAFTTDQFPYACWWQHPDIVEEMTAWWGMWIGYIHNSDAHPADPAAFHERTASLKQRLGSTYRGRCRHGHVPVDSAAVVVRPPAVQTIEEDLESGEGGAP